MTRRVAVQLLGLVVLFCAQQGCRRRDAAIGDWVCVPSEEARVALHGATAPDRPMLSFRQDGSATILGTDGTWTWAERDLLLLRVPPGTKPWARLFPPDPRTGAVTIRLRYSRAEDTLGIELVGGVGGTFKRLGGGPPARALMPARPVYCSS